MNVEMDDRTDVGRFTLCTGGHFPRWGRETIGIPRSIDNRHMDKYSRSLTACRSTYLLRLDCSPDITAEPIGRWFGINDHHCRCCRRKT